MPEAPCVNTEVKSSFAKLHQHDLFDLQTPHIINDFFLSLIPVPPLTLFSHPAPMLIFPLPFLFFLFCHTSFSQSCLLIILHIPLSLCFSPRPSSLLLLYVISFISFFFLPPDLPLHILPLPSLPPYLPLPPFPSLPLTSLAGCSLQ